jgi:Co/Zn/Cd efflux system component
VVEEIREAVEDGQSTDRTRLTDLHVWRVGKQAFSCALSVVTDDLNLSATELRRRLAVHEEIVHATIEVHYFTETPQSTATTF